MLKRLSAHLRVQPLVKLGHSAFGPEVSHLHSNQNPYHTNLLWFYIHSYPNPGFLPGVLKAARAPQKLSRCEILKLGWQSVSTNCFRIVLPAKQTLSPESFVPHFANKKSKRVSSSFSLLSHRAKKSSAETGKGEAD